MWWFHAGNPPGRFAEARPAELFCRNSCPILEPFVGEIMEPASSDVPAFPDDVLIVEDDPIIALDFEDTILGFGVKTVRTAGSVARALQLIAERAPDFALLDVGLVREKSFAIAERLEALEIPFAFVTGYGADVGLPAALRDRPRLPKPCSADALEAVLKQRLARASAELSRRRYRRRTMLAQLRIERRRPQRDVGAVAQGHGHLPGRAVDLDMTEELHAGGRRQVLLVRRRAP